MATGNNQSAVYLYRLTFKNTITAPEKELKELIMDQGARNVGKDEEREYYLTLGGVKINRKIYQPLEIEAELTIEQKSGSTTQAPSFSNVSTLLLRRMVKLELMKTEQTSDNNEEPEKILVQEIARNCYVYEIDPQLKRNNNGMQMYVKMSIFSMDKLMTLNQYSKAYVARKLGLEILQPESLEFGTYTEDTPLVETNISGMRFLMYKDGAETREFIQPYLVQYNESFYDFLVRTSNRCGEFLFFEDGKLNLGLPETEEVVTLSGFEWVTMQSISNDPMVVDDYARDSVKDGVGDIKDLNQTVIKKGSTGFPDEVFPAKLSANSELATDEYIFPLFKDKFSKTAREMFYYGDGADIAMFQAFKAGKTIFSNTLDAVGGVLGSLAKATIVDHGVQAALSGMQQSTVNKEKEKLYLEPLKDKKEQYDGNKVVEFAALSAAGWTTLNYYNDIFKYEEAQQRKIVCINMGTTFAPVTLGQKIKIDGLEDSYVIIQIQQVSEEAWTRNYEKYNSEKSDKFTGKRSLKIFAIPAFKKSAEDTVELFVPPVQPVPVVRKSGPQTAYVIDNEDPKFQGRVRIAYPWQSDGSGLKTAIVEGEQKLQTLDATIAELKDQRSKLLRDLFLCSYFRGDLTQYVEASAEERKKTMDGHTAKLAEHTKKVAELEASVKQLKAEIDTLEQATPVDETKLQLKKWTREQKEKELKDEKDQKEATEKLIATLNAAAKEHDERKGKDKTYREPDYDNSVIKANKDTWSKDQKKYKELGKQIDEAEKQKAAINTEIRPKVKALKQKIKEMASPWVRIATPMATPGGGSFYRPRKGDEVLVNFDCDNVERPYVVGSLFSKNVLTPDERYYRKQSPELQWKNISMAISSPNGHHISFTDPTEGGSFITNLISPGLGFYGGVLGFNKFASGGKDLAGGIHIGDRYGLYEIEMKSHKRAIEIKSPLGTVSINAFTGITISAPNGDVKIQGKNITLEAGNKVTINSGTNLPQPDFGEAPSKKTKAADITKAVIGGVGTALVDQFASSVVDLSTIRHIIEVFVRPVDGTTLIKSRKFLRLEAGLGKATVKHSQYKGKTSEKMKTEQAFFLTLIDEVAQLNSVVGAWITEYKNFKSGYLESHKKFIDTLNVAIKEDQTLPDIAKLAMDEVNNPSGKSAEDIIKVDNFKDKFNETFTLEGVEYRGKDAQFEAIFPILSDYFENVRALYSRSSGEKVIARLQEIGGDDFKWMDDAAKKTLKEGWAGDQIKTWHKTLEDALKRNGPDDDFERVNPKDPFETGTFFRRAILLLFLKNVYDAEENKKENPGKLDKLTKNTFKYFYIGYKEADVTDPKKVDLSVDYWWKRQVHVIDRYSQNSLLRTLWDSTAGKLLNDIYDNTVGMFKKETDRQVWGSEKEGQILFSDREDCTMNFDGASVHVETDANQGSIEHLKWMMRGL